jgi:tRNA (cmo5U34)-methyltransferase
LLEIKHALQENRVHQVIEHDRHHIFAIDRSGYMARKLRDGNFDKAPPVGVEKYDSAIRSFCGAYEEIFKLSYCCLKAALPLGARVLVVGAGTGMEITEFAPLSPGWSFLGVDPSAKMLSLARKKISEKKIGNKIRLVQGYTDDLDDKEGFDGATCILVMHFLKDDGAKLNLLKSIHQRLKPGATLTLVDGCGKPGSRAFEEAVKAWKQYPVIHGLEHDYVEKAFRKTILKMVQFVPESRILELLKEAGFTNIFKYYSGFLYSGWTARKR